MEFLIRRSGQTSEPVLASAEIAVSPHGGRAILVLNGDLVVVEPSWEIMTLARSDAPLMVASKGGLPSVAWSEDGERLVAWSGEETAVFDARSGTSFASRSGVSIGNSRDSRPPTIVLEKDAMIEIHDWGLVRWFKLPSLEKTAEGTGNGASVNAPAKRVIVVRGKLQSTSVFGPPPALDIYDLDSARLLLRTTPPQGWNGLGTLGDAVSVPAIFSADATRFAIASGDIDVLDLGTKHWVTFSNPENRYVLGLPEYLGMNRWDSVYFTSDPTMCRGNAAGALVVATPMKARTGRQRTCLVLDDTESSNAVIAELPISPGFESARLKSRRQPFATDAACPSPDGSVVAYLEMPASAKSIPEGGQALELVLFEPATDHLRFRVPIAKLPDDEGARSGATAEATFSSDGSSVHVRFQAFGERTPRVDQSFDSFTGQLVPDGSPGSSAVVFVACRVGQYRAPREACDGPH